MHFHDASRAGAVKGVSQEIAEIRRGHIALRRSGTRPWHRHCRAMLIALIEGDCAKIWIVSILPTMQKLANLSAGNPNSPRFQPDERHVFVARVGERFTALIYSYRIAAIGSIRAARSAGKREAALAIAVKMSIDPTRIAGSRGEVS